MTLDELLNETLTLVEKTSNMDIPCAKSWIYQNEKIYVSNQNIEQFSQNLENIYSYNEKIYTKFTREKIYKFVEKELANKKKSNQLYTQEKITDFFSEFENQKSYERYIISPISGIRLDNGEKINISIFEIGKSSNLKHILSNDTDGYYISVKINNIYDDLIAMEEAKNKFLDFIRLVVFLYGKNDKKILIKTGLPSYQSVSHEQMYVETSSYQIAEAMNSEFPSSVVNNTYLEKIPIDNEFFYNNTDFVKLWAIHEKMDLNKKVSKMEVRLLNAAISIGESALSNNVKNSIIYTSMALEILLSFDEGSLFQKSIGEKLSDIFAFMIGSNKESRLSASKAVKTFYSLRSALVHGGSKKVNNDYVVINLYLRAIINQLLNHEKYKSIKNIDNLYAMVKEAQYSY